jgi:hypothetical protein
VRALAVLLPQVTGTLGETAEQLNLKTLGLNFHVPPIPGFAGLAADLADTVDRDRAAYVKKYFDVDWPPQYLFDLMINSKVGLETVVQMILDAVSLSEKASRGADLFV